MPENTNGKQTNSKRTKNSSANNTQKNRNQGQQKSKQKSQSAKKPQPSAAKQQPKRTYQKRSSGKKSQPVKIIPLGGLGEIGKNLTVVETEKDILIIDCGMTFPDEEMLGIDIVIPDFTYLIKNKDKIRGMVVTHGHEDHIGGIPYLLKQVNIPIYATPLTLGLIEGKLKEHGLLRGANLNEIHPGSVIKLSGFTVEFIHVNHSIPDAVGVAVTTPAGIIVHTGDFKIDTTPIDGEVISLGRFAELGKQGVLALLADSTNAERPGYTPSERIVGASFQNLFKKADGKRIIVATFSSNIHRIQQIIDEAVRCGRKVAVSGRSMTNVINVASERGYLNVPSGVLIDIDMIKNYVPEQLVIITTGSQGEPMSALHRMAFSDHRKVVVTPGDFIIISATPIPGNEKLVGKVVNELMKLGAEVVYEKMYDVHVSGHACREELKLMLSLTNPKFFIPVHGEQKHLVKHAGLAEEIGIDKKNILIANIGNVIELTKNSMKITDSVTAGRVLVDGLGVGDVGSIVLRDRKHLAEDGIFVVAVTVDPTTNEVISGPDIISRGFVYVKESENLIDEAREIACDAIEKCYLANIHEWSTVKNKIRDAVSKFLYEKTRRSPMILPIIMEV